MTFTVISNETTFKADMLKYFVLSDFINNKTGKKRGKIFKMVKKVNVGTFFPLRTEWLQLAHMSRNH